MVLIRGSRNSLSFMKILQSIQVSMMHQVSYLLNAFASPIQALNLCFISWCLCQKLVLRFCIILIISMMPLCSFNTSFPKKEMNKKGLMDNLLVLLSVNTKTGSGKLNLGSSTSALANGRRVRGKGC